MNPLLIMALLSAASAAANYKAQDKVDKTRANAMSEEARRRKAAEGRAAESAQSTTQLLTNAGRNQDTRAAELEAEYTAKAPPPGTATAGLTGFTAPGRSTLTVGSDQRAAARANADVAKLAHAKAGLNAYGDAMVGAQIGANRNQTDINQQNTGVRNWSQYVLPAKLARAQAAGQDWGTLADALQLASAIYGPIGLSKGAAVVGGGGAANLNAISAAGGGAMHGGSRLGQYLTMDMGIPPY
jgi:hypothetical protein